MHTTTDASTAPVINTPAIIPPLTYWEKFSIAVVAFVVSCFIVLQLFMITNFGSNTIDDFGNNGVALECLLFFIIFGMLCLLRFLYILYKENSIRMLNNARCIAILTAIVIPGIIGAVVFISECTNSYCYHVQPLYANAILWSHLLFVLIAYYPLMLVLYSILCLFLCVCTIEPLGESVINCMPGWQQQCVDYFFGGCCNCFKSCLKKKQTIIVNQNEYTQLSTEPPTINIKVSSQVTHTQASFV
jgi:hypothetical protein